MLELLLNVWRFDQCRETVVMGQISKLCFDRFAIADVAADATIALEATGFIEDRHATRTRPAIAIGAAAQILKIAEGEDEPRGPANGPRSARDRPPVP